MSRIIGYMTPCEQAGIYCPDCGKEFQTEAAYKRHKKAKHPEETDKG